MRLYVIGPVTGIENGNREAFDKARTDLEAAGFEANVPFDYVPEGESWQSAMRLSIIAMLGGQMSSLRFDKDGFTAEYLGTRFDGVAELPGTCLSRGASCERGICEQLGIAHKPVWQWIEEGPKATRLERRLEEASQATQERT